VEDQVSAGCGANYRVEALAGVRPNAFLAGTTSLGANRFAFSAAIGQKSVARQADALFRCQALGVDALLPALGSTGVRLAGVCDHMAGIAFAVSRG